MAATQLQHLDVTPIDSISSDGEAQTSNSGDKRGGWITFPFLTGTVTGLTLAGAGWSANLIVYMIEEFNIKSIDAAQIANVVNGCVCLFPVIGAIIANSFFGSFSVMSISSCISLLGIIFLGLTASLDSLRPPGRQIRSSLCKSPSKVQFVVLYAGLAMGCVGLGGTRFTVATMGANQFDRPKDQGTFFNWYFFALYISSVISSTAIVYIQDSNSWRLGFGLCIAANLLGLVIFLLGNRYYLHDKPKGSPFVDLARVIVAALRKRKLVLSSRIEDYYQEHNGSMTNTGADQIKHNHNFSCVQHVKSTNCTPEDNKSFGYSFFKCIKFLTHLSLITGRPLTPLQQIGVGHVLNLTSMVVSALVESKRLKVAHAHHLQDQPGSMVPMLVALLVLVGIGEAFHFPGQIGLCYQEFPVSLRSTSTAMIALLLGIGFYLSTAITDLVRRVTDWLQDNINNGRLDNVYWTLVVIAVIKFGYYVVCSRFYKYRNFEKGEDDNSVSHNKLETKQKD
ncbi:hypothetical protein ACOSQ2_016749 [Xanthoceras sorbifolium]